MPIWMGKTTRNVFGTFIALLAFVPMDSSYFFPLANHSDLRFQLFGEALEVVALIVLGCNCRRS